MARWIIERCDPDYRDEQTGHIPWAVCNLDDPDYGRDTFNTRAEATAHKKWLESLS